MKKWVVAKCDRELAKQLALECDIDPMTALIAASRGITDPTDLDQFLSDEPIFSNPLEMADMALAAELLNNAVENGVKIAVFGDYDCDGVTATALLYSYLKGRGADCVYYIPDRFAEGYGMNTAAVEELAKQQVGMIVTVDNGIACHEEVARAKELGMQVVVTDHHLPGEILPPADAVVDPHRADCASSFKDICGAQVAFALMCAAEGREPEELIPYFADVLSVAVVADLMPLILENRCIVKYGLEKLKTNPVKGLSALMNTAGIDRKTMNARHIAFGLAPRINAAGRIGNAAQAVELLLSDNMTEALKAANELDEWNTRRQQIEKDIFREAEEQIEQNGYANDRVIVVAGEHWHSGVAGIVASRVTERYGCPSLVICVEGESATGSGRSIEGFSLYDALAASSGALTRFGGHPLAAGISLAAENIDRFRRDINAYADGRPLAAPVLRLDCKLTPSALSLDLAEALEALEPFGQGNPAPLFGIFGVTLQRVTPLSGGKHLRLLFSKGQSAFQGLLFGVTPEAFCFEPGDLLDVAVTAETNFYNGEYSLTVQIKALRMSGIDDDQLFRQIDAYRCFASGRAADRALLLPTREEIGEIYKAIVKKPCQEERLRVCFLNTPGFAKTKVALTVLCELGLIEQNERGIYRKSENGQKTELIHSPTYKNLLEGSENT